MEKTNPPGKPVPESGQTRKLLTQGKQDLDDRSPAALLIKGIQFAVRRFGALVLIAFASASSPRTTGTDHYKGSPENGMRIACCRNSFRIFQAGIIHEPQDGLLLGPGP